MRILETVSTKNTDVKHILKEEFGMTSGLITKIKYNGQLLINGKESKVIDKVKVGDKLKIFCPHTQNENIICVDGILDILYEDEDVLCINKPSKMPTHPSLNHHSDTLANIAMNYLLKNDNELHIVTRLDSLTSGIVLIAKNSFSASKMCTKEYNLSIDKEYTGICRGLFKNKSGIIEAPIARCDSSIIKRCVCETGKNAKTAYEVLKEINGHSICKFKLFTGRTHQIRVHCQSIGHPLLNDFLYDAEADMNKSFKLYCTKLTFIHPLSKEKKTVSANLPKRFLENLI